MSESNIITPKQFAGGGGGSESFGSKLKMLEVRIDTVMLAVRELARLSSDNRSMANNQGLIMTRAFEKLKVDVNEVIKELNDEQEAKAKEAEVTPPESKL